MAVLDLAPIARVAGFVTMPGSKSISNRVLLLAALANGETVVRDALEADDTRVMLAALRALGIKAMSGSSPEIRVQGCAGVIPVRSAELFLGNAGTALRPLTAVLAMAGGEYRLSGVPRMHERPIGDLVDALRATGARIDYAGVDGFPQPVRPSAATATNNIPPDRPIRTPPRPASTGCGVRFHG